MSFAQLLAFYADCDRDLMMHIFRQSRLWSEERAKEKAPDYLDRTISKAIEWQREKYRPRRPAEPSSGHSHSHSHRREEEQEREQQQEPRRDEASDVDLLNALVADVFRTPGLKFLEEGEWRGDVIRMNTNKGWIEWPSSTELGDYKTSRAIVCASVCEFLLGPDIKAAVAWDRVARLIVNLARRNRTIVQDPVMEEVGDAVTMNWNRSKGRVAGNNTDIIRFVEEGSKPRDAWQDCPPCVFVAEGYVYVFPGELKRWYSLQNVNGRDIPWPTIIDGLEKWGFEEYRLFRREGGKKCEKRVRRVPVTGRACELLTKYVDDDPES